MNKPEGLRVDWEKVKTVEDLKQLLMVMQPVMYVRGHYPHIENIRHLGYGNE